jgi:tetratricopeptide (TPR) repeat protein/VanZ family protein
MSDPLIPSRHIVSGDTRPAIVRFCASVFGDRVFGGRVKFAVTAVLACALSYVLLARNPWWILGLADRLTVPNHGGGDKICHFIGYFGLTLVFLWYSTSKSLRFALLLVGTAAVHGGATELLQQHVPGRVSDLSDFWANLIGVTVGTVVGLILRRLANGEASPTDALGIHAGDRSQLTAVRGGSRSSGSSEPISLTRDAMTGDQIADIRFRVVNFRFLGIFASVMLILFGSVYAIHGWQIRRNVRDLRTLGEKARAAGEVERAQRFYSQYVGLVPNDVNALADYGVLLDEARLSPEAGRHAFMVYENVLRVDPAREDIRRRQIHVALSLDRTTDALAHVEILRQTHPADGELDFLAGRCHEKLVDFQKAAASYEAAIEHDPRQIEAWSHLANLYQNSLDLKDQARAIVDRLVDENSRDAEAWLVRARFFEQTGEIDKASADLEKARELDPDSEKILLAAAEIGYAKARAARTAGRDGLVERTTVETRLLIEQGLKLSPGNLDLRLRLVVLESHFGDPQHALSLLESILEETPGESRSQILLADLTIAQGDFERAREAIASLPRTPGSDAMRLFLEGRVAMASEKWEEAARVLTEARRFLPNSNGLAERTDLALAQCFGQLQNNEDETRAYRRILKYHTESIPARLGLAATHLRADRLAEAIAEYQPLRHLSTVRLTLVRLLIIQNLRMPDVARSWLDVTKLLDAAREAGDNPTLETLFRAEMLTAREKYDEAEALIKSAQASQTGQVEFRLALSRIAERTGDPQRAALWLGQALAAAGSEDAEEKLIEATKGESKNAEAAQTLMRFYLARNRRDDAVAEFRRQAPQMTQQELAETYALFGDTGRAVDLFRKELKQHPQDVAALEGLADVLLTGGNPIDAEPVLRESIELPATTDSDREAISLARRKLAVLLSSTRQFTDWKEAVSLLDENDAASERPGIEDSRARATVLANGPASEQREAAVKLLENLDDRNQLTPADRWLLGRLYQEAGQSEQAATQLKRALEHAPDAAVLVTSYVETLLQRGELKSASGWLHQLTELAPNAAETVRLEAALSALTGDAEHAEKRLRSFTKVGRQSGHEPTLRLVKAAELAEFVASQLRQSDTPESPAPAPGADAKPARDELALQFEHLAESFLREAVSRDPSQLHPLVVYLMNNGRDQEIAALIEPVWTSLPPQTAAGLSLAMLGSSSEARQKMDVVERNLLAALKANANAASSTSVSGNPSRLLLRLCLADLRSLQGDYREAERLYHTILQTERGFVPAMNNLAWLLARQGNDLDEASLMIDQAIEIAGPAPELLDTRGCVSIALGQNRNGLDFLERSLKASPESTTLLHLASARHANGEEPKARTTFRRAIAAGLQRSRLHPLDQQLFDMLDSSNDAD